METPIQTIASARRRSPHLISVLGERRASSLTAEMRFLGRRWKGKDCFTHQMLARILFACKPITPKTSSIRNLYFVLLLKKLIKFK